MAACGLTQRDHTAPAALKNMDRLYDSLNTHNFSVRQMHHSLTYWCYDNKLNLNRTNHSAFVLGSSLVCWENCCTASWWAAFTLWATHTVYCKGTRSILGSDCRQNCCLLSNPSCKGISGDTSTATPAWREADGRGYRILVNYIMRVRNSKLMPQRIR